jgi:iron complex outermembrane receptor protein
MRFFILFFIFFLIILKGNSQSQSEIELLTFEQEFISGAIKAKQKPEEAPSSFLILSGEDFKKFNFISLGDALNYMPGMWGIYNWTTYNFGLRGIHAGPKGGSRILKTMLDSEDYLAFRPSGEALLGPEFVPPSFIKSVEVVKGPASALYGANAFLGVINVTTRDPDEMPPFSFRISPGLFKNKNFQGAFEVASAHVFQIGEAEIPFGIGIYHFNQKRDGLKISDESIRFSDLAKDKAKFEFLKGQTSKDDTLSALSVLSKTGLRYDVFNLEIKGIFQGFSASSQFPENENSILLPQNRTSIYTAGGSAKLSGDIKFSEVGWVINPSFYSGLFVSGHLKEKFLIFEPDRKVIRYGEKQETYLKDFGSTSVDLRFETSAKKDKNLILVGADLINDNEKIESLYKLQDGERKLEFKPEEPKKTFRNLGVYGQIYALPIERIYQAGEFSILGAGFLLGARYDDHNIYEDVFNTRVGAVILPLKKAGLSTYVKGIFGTSFRAPSPEQLFITATRPGDLDGNPNLKPEKSKITEGIVGGTFEIPVGFEQIELKPEISIYTINVKDAIEFDKKGNYIKPINRPSKLSQGFDISLGIRFWKIKSNFAYSSVQSKVKEEFLGEVKDIENKFFPQNMFFFSALFSQSIGESYEIDLGIFGRYIGKRNISTFTVKWIGLTEIPDRPLPPYFTSGISLSAGTKKIGYITKIYVRAENIFNKNYWEPGFTGFDIPQNPFWFLIGLESIL